MNQELYLLMHSFSILNIYEAYLIYRHQAASEPTTPAIAVYDALPTGNIQPVSIRSQLLHPQ